MIGMAVAGVAGRMGGHIVRAIGRQAEAGLAAGFEAPAIPPSASASPMHDCVCRENP